MIEITYNENKIKKSIATFAAYATKHATTF